VLGHLAPRFLLSLGSASPAPALSESAGALITLLFTAARVLPFIATRTLLRKQVIAGIVAASLYMGWL